MPSSLIKSSNRTMITFVKRIISRVLERNGATLKMLSLYRLRHHLEEIGWFRSVMERLPVDRDGNPLPWFTYSAIYLLDKKVKPEMTVFEYGSGNSTIWWSKRVTSIMSCEHNLDWYNSLREKLPSNVEYLYRELVYGGEYSRTILESGDKFDIVVIDGRDRVNCAKNSLGALKGNGVIIWDNSDRDKYQEGYSYLIQNGFKRLDCGGHGPINTYKWCTSIFYRSNNCLDF